jgi:chromosome segregation ATPase
MRDHQLEALLEGAALHREEMERFQSQLAEMDALVKELQHERDDLDARLVECDRVRGEQRVTVQELRDELLRVGRDLARAQGELRRCQDERDRIAEQLRAVPVVGEAGIPAATLRSDLDREVRERQRLQLDLEQRLHELDEVRRLLRERDRSIDAVRSEDTEHRAELRDLRRQVRDLEERLATDRVGRETMPHADLARAAALMTELEDRLRAEAQRLATIEEQLRIVARGVGSPLLEPPST